MLGRRQVGRRINRNFAFLFWCQLIVRDRHEQFSISFTVGPTHDGALICCRRRNAFKLAEVAALIVGEHGQLAAPASRHDQVFPAVSIEIVPAHPGSQATQPAGQERLPGPIIERIRLVRVPNPSADVLKKRLLMGP